MRQLGLDILPFLQLLKKYHFQIYLLSFINKGFVKQNKTLITT